MGTVRTSRGMTLVETIIVLVLVGILSGVVWFGYSAIQGRGSLQQATEALGAVSSLETASVLSHGSFISDPAALAAGEPGYTYVGGYSASTSPTEISVAVAVDGLTVGLASLGDDARCYVLVVSDPSLGQAELKAIVTGDCTGDAALTAPAGSWS